MSFSVACPNCHKTLKATSGHIGKRAKCPACGTSVVIAKPHDTPPPIPAAPTVPVETPPPIPAASTIPEIDPTESRFKRRSPTSNAKSVTLPVAALMSGAAIVVGYFAGREHIKYELRAAMTSAGEAVRESMKNAFSGSATTAEEKAELEAFERQPALAIGAIHEAAGFSLALLESRVGSVEAKQSFGDETYETKEKYLVFTFRVKNTDERKILNFYSGSSFGPGSFCLLVDDVGNDIRHSFLDSDNLAGTISIIDDILPGDERTHVEAFTIPPPKTQHLILTVNLQSFGGEGRIKYKIPAAQISGFPVSE